MAVSPLFHLDNLLAYQLNVNVSEFELKFQTELAYQYTTHMLCVNISSEITLFTIKIQQMLQAVECQKILVNNFFDYGQYSTDDSENTKNPFGPYAKVFDSCSLSNKINMTIKSYTPFPNKDLITKDNIEYLRSWWWLGSGKFD